MGDTGLETKVHDNVVLDVTINDTKILGFLKIIEYWDNFTFYNIC